MKWLRWMLVLLIPATYVAGAMLVGTLLAGKVAGPRPSPQQLARYDETRAFSARYEVRPYYRADDHLDVLDRGPAELKFLSVEEFVLLVAEPACLMQRIPYAGSGGQRETFPDQRCLTRAKQMGDFDSAYPTPYTAAEMCGPLRIFARQDWSSTAFIFHEPESCLDVAAKAMQWKGYFELKDVCRVEAERILPKWPDASAENLARQCVLQNVTQWAKRELDICQNTRISSPGKCR